MTSTDALGTFVLVVDDDDDLRDTVGELLESRGYDVGRASDGIAALEFLRANASQPDLILLDLMMPRMNGWELRTALLADTELAKVPVVVMTASRNMDEQSHPRFDGAPQTGDDRRARRRDRDPRDASYAAIGRRRIGVRRLAQDRGPAAAGRVVFVFDVWVK